MRDRQIRACNFSHLAHPDIAIQNSVLKHYVTHCLLCRRLLLWQEILLSHRVILQLGLAYDFLKSLALNFHLILPSTLGIEPPLDVDEPRVRVVLVDALALPVARRLVQLVRIRGHVHLLVTHRRVSRATTLRRRRVRVPLGGIRRPEVEAV